MIESQWVTRTGMVMAIATTVGCTRAAPDEEQGPRTSKTRSDASQEEDSVRAGAPARDKISDAGKGGSGGGGGSAAATRKRPLPPITPELCSAQLQVPELTCADDVGEPNDSESPVALALDGLCGYVAAVASRDDEDAYAFTTPRSDPLLVELAAQGMALDSFQQTITDEAGNTVDSNHLAGSSASLTMSRIIQTQARVKYHVTLSQGTRVDTCQRYALRLDPQWCTDEHEDDDDLKSAYKPSWDANQRIVIDGTIARHDDDFVEITTQRADPVLVQGKYTAPADSELQLERVYTDGAGNMIHQDQGGRTGESETFARWLPAKSAQSVLRTQLSGNGSGCAKYEISFDAAACTDKYEDNDSATHAAALTAGQTLEATVHFYDEDHFALAALKNTTCTVTYAVAPGEMQSLRMGVYDAAGSTLGSGNGGELSGTQRSLKVSWTNHEAARLKVESETNESCQPYTLRCDPTPASM